MKNNNYTINLENKTIVYGQREFEIRSLDVSTSKLRLKDTDELHGGELNIHISIFFGDEGAEIFKEIVDKFLENVN